MGERKTKTGAFGTIMGVPQALINKPRSDRLQIAKGGFATPDQPNRPGCERPARSWASTAATAVMLRTPRAVTPGVRICAGREGPIRIGPTGSASASTLII